MTIAAVLVWFDETTETLDRCITSLAGVADRIVALDGPWHPFPHETCASDRDQHDAIRDAAAATGAFESVTVMPARRPWRSQVAKRAAALELARIVGSDWLLVIDADEHVERCDPDELRRRLAATRRDVAEVCFRTYGGGVRFTKSVEIRRIYRAASGVTVETAHNGYRTSDGRWLHGDGRHVRRETAVNVSDALAIAHDRDARGSERQLARATFIAERKRLKTESWKEAAVA